MKKIIVIAGATASGKSDLALKMARTLNGAVVNADSVQVYADLPLLTARPTNEDMQGTPHYLYGYLNCHQNSTVLNWLERAANALAHIQNPVVVGGTGMYIDALINGINEIPDVPPEIRERVRQMPLDDVKAHVADCTAVDPQRLRRALEVQWATGKPLAWFQRQPRKKYVQAEFVKIWLNPPRDVLYQRCNARFLKMLDHGAIDEVAALNEQNPGGGVKKAIGYAQITAFLNGEITREEMVGTSTQATRNYAKRQITWFKNQLNADLVLESNTQEIDFMRLKL